MNYQRKLIAIFVVFLLAIGVNAQDSVVLHTFDNDVEGFVLAADLSAGESLGVVDGALAIGASFSGEVWEEARVYSDPEGGVDWSLYDTLAVDVFVPHTATGFIAQIFVLTGANRSWANTPDLPLNAGEWTTIVANLTDMGNRSEVYEYGVKVGTSSNRYSGNILIDNIRLYDSGNEPVHRVEAIVNEITSVIPLNSDTVPRYEKFELGIEMDAQFNNPYDPLEIRLDGEFRNPEGEIITVPGFYMEVYETVSAHPRSTGEFSWRVRFAPMEIGEWEYRVIATTPNRSVESEWQSFMVTGSDNKGFIRVDERNPHYFAFDDGTPYFPIGENVAWSMGQPIADYETWLDHLALANANFIRVWMASWGFGIEWLDTGLGDYSKRQNRAYQLDEVLNLAHEHDIYILLSLLSHGAFSTDTDTEWDTNPYNAANGGPLANPQDFATNPEARRYWNQRLRYIAARWGYSTNIMAWEWWNEVNWTPLDDEELLVPWIEGSAAFLDELDPYDHLMTHSGSAINDEQVWNLESIDFVQDHQYNMTDMNDTFTHVISQWLLRYPDKPFLMGEFGSPREFDVEGIFLHDGLWSAPMHGASGTAMTWWWDTYIHPNDLYYHFAGVAAFYADEDLAAYTWQATTAETSNRNVQVFGIQANNRALLWVVNQDYSVESYLRKYQQNVKDGTENPYDVTFNTVEDAVLTVNGLQPVTYTIEVWDTITGNIIQTSNYPSAGGTIQVNLPSFTTDLAIKILV